MGDTSTTRRGESGVPEAEATLFSRGRSAMHSDRCPAGPLESALATDLSISPGKDPHMRQEPNVQRPITAGAYRFICAARALGALGAVVAVGGISSAPALAGECANEQLRIENNSTRLPECRAYELVTPPYKEGFAPFLYGYTDDGRFGFTSHGNFDDNGMGHGLGNQYVATRSVTGWTTKSPDPSGPTYAAANGEAFTMSADLRSSIWLMRLADQPANVEELYKREADGTFIRIGPGNNPAKLGPEPPSSVYDGPALPALAGTSTDLTHITFTVVSAFDYPGDASAGVSTLYEYIGIGNEQPILVGVDNTGHQIGTSATCGNGISNDGRVVYFDPGCLGGTPQVWARINATTTIHASASECTRTASEPGGPCNATAPATFLGAANDGSRIFFTTTQQLIDSDTDNTNDLYECDIPAGTPAPSGTANACASLTEISGGGHGANVENVVSISEDGTHVYFTAEGALATNLGTNDAAAVAGVHNLYLWQKDAEHPTGQVKFITRLETNDLSAGTTTLGTGGAQTTADGRYLAFNTANRLLPSDTDEAQDVYRYDADTGTLQRLSTDISGTGGNTPGLNAEMHIPSVANRTRIAMSADGDTVVFLTTEALSPADTNGTSDVYEWHDGHVALISSGRPSLTSVGPQPYALITATGTDIYFSSTAQLTPNDTDTNEDVYDARVQGGYSYATATPCTGESCQEAAGPQPQAPDAPASATFLGEGPLAALTPSTPATTASHPTRAQKLAKTLKACRNKHRKTKRRTCEKNARHAYASGK